MITTVNGRTVEQQAIVNYIVDNMEKVNKEKLETMYEMEFKLYTEGALNEKEHEYIRKQLRKAMKKVSQSIQNFTLTIHFENVLLM